jgi:hypothetical protein
MTAMSLSGPLSCGACRLMSGPWLFQFAISNLILAVGFAFAIVASLAGFPRTICPTCLVTLALFSLSKVVVMLGYWDQSDRLNTFLAALQLIPNIAFTLGIAFFEAQVVRILLVFSTLRVLLPSATFLNHHCFPYM